MPRPSNRVNMACTGTEKATVTGTVEERAGDIRVEAGVVGKVLVILELGMFFPKCDVKLLEGSALQ